MKNIVRWTIGNVSNEGMECLKRSVCNFVQLYKNEFRYFICHNNVEEKKIIWSSKYNIDLINQEKHINELDIHPPSEKNPCWKLYPPRIDINSYEIFIDNDLIIYKKIDLEEAIKSNIFIVSEALEKNYGSFNKKINTAPNFNSGFFGIPAFFDLRKEINKTISNFNVIWSRSHFEEQGLLSYIIKKNKNKIISLDEIYVSFGDYQLAKNGYHFAGLNCENKKFWQFHNTKFI